MHGSGDFPILSANELQSETLVLVPGSSVTSHYTDEKIQEMVQISLKVSNMLLITDLFSIS